ncbi:MAG: integrase family protein [Methylococcaceae bacterium]
MADSFNFTQQRIEKLPTPEKDRKDYYDTEVSKLMCRVSASGNKSFCVLKRMSTGKLQRVTLGKWPDVSVSDARKMAQAALTELAQGVNLTEEKRKQKLRGITLQELLDKYLADKTDLREASILDYTKKVNQGFSDWLNKPICEISRDMVLARRKQFEGGRDNKLRVLRLLMRYAVVTLKALDENPVDVLRDGSLWKKPTRKKRMIQSDNLKDWYQSVLNLENERAKVYLLLLIHTGLRDTDVRYLEWKDVDFKNDCFIARNTKNHSDFTAYIAPQIKPYLRSLQALTGNGQYLFTGDAKDGIMNIPRKPITQVCNETGIEFSSHDLKRTFLTIGEAAMIPFSLLKALANHKTDSDVTGGYINPEANTLRQATYKIADYIEARTRPDDANVISIKKTQQTGVQK